MGAADGLESGATASETTSEGGEPLPYELFEGEKGLARVETGWTSLEARCADHVFQTYAYARRWHDIICEPAGYGDVVRRIERGKRIPRRY